MRTPVTSPLLAFVALATLASCSAVSQPASSPPDPTAKRVALERDVAIAREKLAKARRDVAQEESSGQSGVVKARGDLGLAQAKARDFDEKEAPNRLAKARLELRDAHDALQDSKEELEQLELMYKEQDLADKTREIVIRRSKRQIQRAEDRLNLQESELKTLEERTLTLERQKLALDNEDRQRDLERASRAAEASLTEKRIASMSAEADLAKLESELLALSKDAK